MAQAPTDQDTSELPSAFEEARKAVKHSRSAARDADRALARLRDELAERGLKIGVYENHGPNQGEGS